MDLPLPADLASQYTQEVNANQEVEIGAFIRLQDMARAGQEPSNGVSTVN